MKRSNPESSKKSTSIGFFSNTKRAKIEPLTADAAFSAIPHVPHNIPLFQHNEKEDPWEKCYSAREVWDKLENPVTTVPGHHMGLHHLREIAKQGVATVIPYNKPTTVEQAAAHQFLAAGPVIYANPRTKKKNLPGIVFHPGNSTLTAHIRGKANPHLGFGRQHGHNKLWEWKLVSRIDPTAMPETIAIDELPILTDPKMVLLRLSIHKCLDRIVQKKSREFTQKATKELACYIKNIFDALRIKFPEGAFIKSVDGSSSADLGYAFTTTMATKEETLAENFAKEIPFILQTLSEGKNIESPEMRIILLSQSNPIFLIFHDLLFKPEEVIGQRALKIAKTDWGCNFEVRVDFLQGKALRSGMRFEMSDCYPQETKAAADFLDQFFQKASYQHRMLCGGADIALGEDGNWHIIEFNLGAESMGLDFGIRWNCYVSSLLGRNTELISIFERIFAAPLEEQKKFLSGLELSIFNHPDNGDLADAYQWFRDRHCQLFSTHPTCQTREQILLKLRHIFSGVSFQYHLWAENFVNGALKYMNRELAKKKIFLIINCFLHRAIYNLR